MFNSNSISPREVTGTIVLTITYGFVGQVGKDSVNSTASATLQLNFQNQNVVKVVEESRRSLISNLDESLQSNESRQRFGVCAQKIFDLYHVISEAQMFIP